MNSKTSEAESQHTQGIHIEIEQLQKLLLQKERDLGKLQMVVDTQSRKIDSLEKDNQELRENLMTSSSGDSLKQKVNDLNNQLKKQVNLNRLQAAQILEHENALW